VPPVSKIDIPVCGQTSNAPEPTGQITHHA
jgi:hypothetical protein